MAAPLTLSKAKPAASSAGGSKDTPPRQQTYKTKNQPMAATLTLSKAKPAASSAGDSKDTPPLWRGGQIKRLVLSNEGRALAPETAPYDTPLGQKKNDVHDTTFSTTLTQLYRERLRPGSVVLDLMSSHTSHLPAEAKYKRVVEHPINSTELLRNDRLDSFFVKDLNQDGPSLPETMTDTFDAVLCASGMHRVQQPERVFSEIWRVLRPGGVCIVSFGDVMPAGDDVIAAWRHGTARSRTRLVSECFKSVAGFTEPHVVRSPLPPPPATAPHT